MGIGRISQSEEKEEEKKCLVLSYDGGFDKKYENDVVYVCIKNKYLMIYPTQVYKIN